MGDLAQNWCLVTIPEMKERVLKCITPKVPDLHGIQMTSELVSFHHYNTYPRQSVYRDEVICSRSGGFISADSLLSGLFLGNLKAMVDSSEK